MQQDPNAKAVIEKGIRAILERSASDYAFRQKLLADSRSAIAEFAGVSVDKLAPGSISFIESTPGASATFVLPKFGEKPAELSDADLEAVAGGTEPITVALFAGYCFVIGAEAALIAYEIGKYG
jgi:hypothetical protein